MVVYWVATKVESSAVTWDVRLVVWKDVLTVVTKADC